MLLSLNEMDNVCSEGIGKLSDGGTTLKKIILKCNYPPARKTKSNVIKISNQIAVFLASTPVSTTGSI